MVVNVAVVVVVVVVVEEVVPVATVVNVVVVVVVAASVTVVVVVAVVVVGLCVVDEQPDIVDLKMFALFKTSASPRTSFGVPTSVIDFLIPAALMPTSHKLASEPASSMVKVLTDSSKGADIRCRLRSALNSRTSAVSNAGSRIVFTLIQ